MNNFCSLLKYFVENLNQNSVSVMGAFLFVSFTPSFSLSLLKNIVLLIQNGDNTPSYACMCGWSKILYTICANTDTHAICRCIST